MIGDIERLIKKKIEIEPLELDDAPPRREPYRDRARREDDERPARPAAGPRPAYSAPRLAADPFFDKPYEAPADAPEPAWEAKAPAAPRGLSSYIKPKKKVAALFGAKNTDDVPVA